MFYRIFRPKLRFLGHLSYHEGWFDGIFMDLSQRGQLWLNAIQHGFIITLPVVVLGALSLTIMQLPMFFSSLSADDHWLQVANWIWQGSYGVMSLTLVMSISYYFTQHFQAIYDLDVRPITVSLLALISLVSMIVLKHSDGQLNFGVSNVATAILCAVAFTELFIFFYRYRLWHFNYLNFELDDSLSLSFRALVPAVISVFLLIGVYSLIQPFFSSLQFILPWLLGEVDPVAGLTAWQSSFLMLVNQGLWFVGIHGASIIESALGDVFSQNPSTDASRMLINAFVHIGGAGTTMGLLIVMLVGRHLGNRQLAKYALIPSLFNINELIIFGLPIIFNRYFFLPFLCVPIFVTFLSYIAMNLGWIVLNDVTVAWSTPIIVSGYLVSGFAGVVLQLVALLIAMGLYLPFLKRYEVVLASQQQVNRQSLIKQMADDDFDMKTALRERSVVGELSRQIANDLKKAMAQNQLELFYQPKVDKYRIIKGAEALLRWEHPTLGYLPPNVFVNIAEINGDIHRLGMWAIEQCLKDMVSLDKAGVPQFTIAINVSPLQLIDREFIGKLHKRVSAYRIDPHRIELEITEGQPFIITDELLAGFKTLSEFGYSLAVDDFGMGYTSLRYLKAFPVNTLKVDGILIKDIERSMVVRDIIRSMVNLADSMKMTLVVEWVETEQQQTILSLLGCHLFQGKLHSMPISLVELVDFCVHHSVEGDLSLE